ncbi:MAG: hypothetical protein EP330_28160 [Deltaproteobacteria bacterium]|nr:MAG: hypothetical protein EP330_28160 [Deltaproteobacteria bacterium]
MRLLPLLALLAGCPKPTPTTPAPEPEPVREEVEQPTEDAPSQGAATVPQAGPDFAAHFTYEDGQVARIAQTLIEQTSVPGLMANRTTIESEQSFEVRADEDDFVVRWGPSRVDVTMEGPEEIVGPLGEALGRLLRVTPTVVVARDGEVQDVLVPKDELDAARTDVQALIDTAPELARQPMTDAMEAMLDPTMLSAAAEAGLAPWALGELLLPFQASTQPDESGRVVTFLGWVPCMQEDTEPTCGAVLVSLEAEGAELDQIRDMLQAGFADLPDEQRPTVEDVNIDEQYVFVLEPESGLPRRVAHDKRTTALLSMEGGQIPYVKNLATAELWTWE